MGNLSSADLSVPNLEAPVESRTHRFPVTDPPPAVEVRNPSGSVTVEARDDADEITVQITALDSSAEQLLDRVDLFFTHARLQVQVPERRLLRTPGFAISVITPAGSSVRVAAASADTTLRGRLGDLELTTASGDVTVAECASLELRTASGDARVGTVSGRMNSQLPDDDGAAGDGPAQLSLTLRSVSGDLRIRRVAPAS